MIYFQNIWTTIINNAKPIQTAVLALIVSPKRIFDKIAKTTIPTLNPINLVGHRTPSDQLTKFLVANIKIQVIGIPIMITHILWSCKNWYLTVPCTWKKTNTCPNILSSIPINRFIFLVRLVCRLSIRPAFWTALHYIV